MLRRTAALALVSLLGTAAAAPFDYDPDVDRFGSAMAAPFARRDSVRKAMEYCGATFQDLRWSAYSEYARWVRRHAAFLQLTIAMRRALVAAAGKEKTGEGARWMRLVEDDLPRSAENASAGLVREIEARPSAEEKRQACMDAIAGVASRKYDIDAVEPATAKYLRDISGKFRIALPAPGETASPGAGTRTDAHALVGKWTTEKIRYYLADGRVSEDDTKCTLDFSGKTLTSDCQVSGRLLRVVSAYEVSAPGRYEARVVENAAYPEMVGERDVTLFRVENGKLVTSSYLPIASADPMRPVEIEAVLAPSVLSGRRPQ
jgi:hypothetical protein